MRADEYYTLSLVTASACTESDERYILRADAD